MSRNAYVDGQYLPHDTVCVHIEGHGYQFGEGVYENFALGDGSLIDCNLHMERLGRSLSELRIPLPMSSVALNIAFCGTVRRNRFKTGIVYVQISQDAARRDHQFPSDDVKPALVVTARPTLPTSKRVIEEGIAVVSQMDIRGDRCGIKSIALLPNVLIKEAARERGAYEALQIYCDGFVMVGGSTKAWIINTKGQLVTRQKKFHTERNCAL